jgi:hypothetical protein
MKLRLWPWGRHEEPAVEEPQAEEAEIEEPEEAAVPPADEPEPEAAGGGGEPRSMPGPPAPPARRPTSQPAGARPGKPASEFARPYVPEAADEAAPALPAEPPAAVSLTIDEAKAAIRAAGGDVIQIGFLANAYRRHREEEPASRETAAARKRLCDLVAKRLADRKLLAPEGRFELLEG